jgi:hypothetical protein
MLRKLPCRLLLGDSGFGLSALKLGDECSFLGAKAILSELTTWPAKGEAVITVPGDAIGGGTGLSDRKRGWINAWLALLSGRVGGRENRSELVSDDGEWTGEWAGDSGSRTSSSSTSGKGPLRGFAGETGRLPGIVSRRGIADRGRKRPSSISSTADVSHVSNPSS